jgi:hypothetical protein
MTDKLGEEAEHLARKFGGSWSLAAEIVTLAETHAAEVRKKQIDSISIMQHDGPKTIYDVCDQLAAARARVAELEAEIGRLKRFGRNMAEALRKWSNEFDRTRRFALRDEADRQCGRIEAVCGESDSENGAPLSGLYDANTVAKLESAAGGAEVETRAVTMTTVSGKDLRVTCSSGSDNPPQAGQPEPSRGDGGGKAEQPITASAPAAVDQLLPGVPPPETFRQVSARVNRWLDGQRASAPQEPDDLPFPGPDCTATEHVGSCRHASKPPQEPPKCLAREVGGYVCGLDRGHVGPHKQRVFGGETRWGEHNRVEFVADPAPQEPWRCRATWKSFRCTQEAHHGGCHFDHDHRSVAWFDYETGSVPHAPAPEAKVPDRITWKQPSDEWWAEMQKRNNAQPAAAQGEAKQQQPDLEWGKACPTCDCPPLRSDQPTWGEYRAMWQERDEARQEAERLRAELDEANRINETVDTDRIREMENLHASDLTLRREITKLREAFDRRGEELHKARHDLEMVLAEGDAAVLEAWRDWWTKAPVQK